MARRPLRLTYLPLTALALAVAGLGGAALTLGNGDAVVERGFQRALAAMAEGPDGTGGNAATLAGTEKFWLTHVVHEATPPIAQPVTIGDRITIASDGGERVLSVVDVRELDSKIIPIASAEPPARLLLVTCRDQGRTDGRAVRFVIEADDDPLSVLSAIKALRTL